MKRLVKFVSVIGVVVMLSVMVGMAGTARAGWNGQQLELDFYPPVRKIIVQGTNNYGEYVTWTWVSPNCATKMDHILIEGWWWKGEVTIKTDLWLNGILRNVPEEYHKDVYQITVSPEAAINLTTPCYDEQSTNPPDVEENIEEYPDPVEEEEETSYSQTSRYSDEAVYPGQIAPDQITSYGETVVFYVPATAGEAIIIRVDGYGNIDPDAKLYSPNYGYLVAENDDCDSNTRNSCFRVTASETGNYVLEVKDYSGDRIGGFSVNRGFRY